MTVPFLGKPTSSTLPSNGDDLANKTYVDGEVAGHAHSYLPLAGGTLTGPLVFPITDPASDYISHTQIRDDGTDTATWPDRLSFAFEQEPGSGNYSRTGWFNEFGELRAASAMASTVAMRVHGHTGGDSTNDVFQVRDQTGGSVNMLRVSLSEAEFQVPLTVQNTTGQAMRLERTGTSTDDIWQVRIDGQKVTYVAQGGALRAGADDPGVETFRVIPPASMSNNIMRVQDGTGADALRIDYLGRVRLGQEPTQDDQAATKAYVDANSGGDYLPLSGGTLTGALVVGSGSDYTQVGTDHLWVYNTGTGTVPFDVLVQTTGKGLYVDTDGQTVIDDLSVLGDVAVGGNLTSGAYTLYGSLGQAHTMYLVSGYTPVGSSSGRTTAIGYAAGMTADGNSAYTTFVGAYADVVGDGSAGKSSATAVGYNAKAGSRGIAIGQGATGRDGGDYTLAMGYNSAATGGFGIAIGGYRARALGGSSVALGYDAQVAANTSHGIAIGRQALVGEEAGGALRTGGIAIGYSSLVDITFGLAIGNDAHVEAGATPYSMVIGPGAKITQADHGPGRHIQIGHHSLTYDSVRLGDRSIVTGDTGWRDVSSLVDSAWTVDSGFKVAIRRVGDQVTVLVGSMTRTGAGSGGLLLSLPSGFQHSGSQLWSVVEQPCIVSSGGVSFQGAMSVWGTSLTVSLLLNQGSGYYLTTYSEPTQNWKVWGSITFPTGNTFPTTLPGTATTI